MTLVFKDGFEDEQFTKSNWETFSEGTWQLMHFDTNIVYEGNQSLRFESGPWITRNFEPMSNAYIKYAFYDLMNTSTVPSHIQCRINDPTGGSELTVGVEMEFSDNYVCRVKGNRIATGIPRTLGWHVFEIWISSSGTTILIDGNFVLINDSRITIFESINFMSSPGPTGAYWDDVQIHSDSLPPSPPPTPPGEIDPRLLLSLGSIGLLTFMLYF